jgi:NADPH:quinone reductase-like Zn-dependent oxidoreductase
VPRRPSSSVLTELLEVGKVAPVIDRTYPLDDVAAAIDHVAEGRARGKVVLDVRPAVRKSGGDPR